MKSAIFTLVTLLISAVAVAKSTDKFGHDEVKFDPDVFAAQQKELSREVRSGQRYAELSSFDRRTVLESLNMLGNLLSEVNSIDELGERDKLRVFNLQETVNTLLTDAADDSRLVCARETKTGSHRSINVCKTVAQKERERLDSVKALSGLQRAPRDAIFGEPDEGG